MTRDVKKIRERLQDGEGTEADYTWAKRRLTVLAEWPDELTIDQKREQEHLASIVAAQ